jgi:hypothetical protein
LDLVVIFLVILSLFDTMMNTVSDSRKFLNDPSFVEITSNNSGYFDTDDSVIQTVMEQPVAIVFSVGTMIYTQGLIPFIISKSRPGMFVTTPVLHSSSNSSTTYRSVCRSLALKRQIPFSLEMLF